MSNEQLADLVNIFHGIYVASMLVNCVIMAVFSMLAEKFKKMFFRKVSVVFAGITATQWWGNILVLAMFKCRCPLSLLEQSLRGDASNYRGSFIGHLLEKWFGFSINESIITATVITFLIIFGTFTFFLFKANKKELAKEKENAMTSIA